MAISLGTIYGSVRIGLDGLQADVAGAQGLFAALTDSIDQFMAGLNIAAPLTEQMDQVDSALEDTDAIQAGLWDSFTVASDEAATATEDAMGRVAASVTGSTEQASTAATSLGERFAAAFSSIQDNLGAFADQAQGVFGRVVDAAKVMDEQVASAGDGFLGLGEKAHEGGLSIFELGKTMLEFEAIAGVTDAVSKFTGSLIGMNSEFESLHAQLTSITGSSGSADKILAWIKQFGQQVPDTTEHLAQATVTIQSLGLNAEQIMPSIANVAAAMGTDLPTAARAFSDAYEGRFMMMQNDLHVTKQQLEQFGLQVGKNGHVINSSLVPAFERLQKAKFAHGIQTQMGTLKGQLSNLTDRVQFFAMALGKPLFDLAKQGLGALFKFLDSHKKQIDDFANTVGKGLAGAFKTLGGFLHSIPGFLQDIGKHFGAAFNDKNGSKVKGLGDLLKSAGDTLKTVGGWIKDNFVPAMEHLADAAGHVAAGISNFINFLQTHDAVMTGFKAALITLGVILIGPVVGGFISAGIAAAGAAIGIIAATWPVLAVVAAITLLVIGIKLLINHWGDIQKFFGNIKDALGNFFGSIGSKIHEAFDNVKNAIGQFFGHLLETIKEWGGKLLELYTWPYREAWTLIHDLLGMIWTVIQTGFHTIVNVVTAPIRLIVGLFNWLYQHNYYFQRLVDTIRKIITGGFKWVTDHIKQVVQWIVGHFDLLKKQAQVKWAEFQALIAGAVQAVHDKIVAVITTVKQWLSAAWDFIKQVALNDWKLFHDYIINPILAVWNFITDKIGQLKNWLRDRWNDIVNDVKGWWTNLQNAVSSGVTAVKNFIDTTFIQPIENMFDLGAKAFQWGKNLLSMFMNGLGSMKDALVQKAKDVLGGLANILGFHSPAEEGPGADADTWAPNLMKMFAQGILSGGPGVAAAALSVANGLHANLAGSGGALGSLTGSAGGSSAGANGAGGSGNLAGATINVTVQVADDGTGGGTSDPASSGEQFGRSLGTALATSLTQHGYNTGKAQ